MTGRFYTYKAYSVTCFVVWGLIFLVRWAFHLPDNGHVILYVFCGWVIGWLSATIARSVYPR